jgi:hypothetical protein
MKATSQARLAALMLSDAQHFATLKQEFVQLDFFCKGTVLQRMTSCAKTRRFNQPENDPPNCPTQRDIFGAQFEFFTQKYLVCNQGVSEVRLATNQKVGSSNLSGRTIESIG